MTHRLASIVIWKEKVFIPTEVRIQNGGPYINTDPVMVVGLSQQEIQPIIQEVLSKDPPVIPNPEKQEFKKIQRRVLKAIGVQSWKQLYLQGIHYSISFTSDKGYSLNMYRLDKKGRLLQDPGKSKKYPPDVDVSIIIQDLFSDLAVRQE